MLTRGISQRTPTVRTSGKDKITPFPLSPMIQTLSSQYDSKIDAQLAELNKLRRNKQQSTANRGKAKRGQRKRAEAPSLDNAEILDISSEVRRLREMRNDHCSATRDLPAEILSIIFRFVSSSASHLWQWVALTYVCRGWRTVALGEPSLWGNLAQLRGQWLERSLSLAKATPLAISYFYPDESENYDSDSSFNGDIEEPWVSDDSESLYNFRDSEISAKAMIMDELLNSPERLGRLRIDNCTNKVINQLDKPTPFLSSLTLEGKFNLTHKFLGDDAPRLQEVTIKGGIIPATSSWLPNLRKLSISISWGISGPAGDRIPLTTSSILDFLKPMRRLEELSLHPCSSKDANSRNYTGPAVPFPQLASIRLTLNRSTLHMSDLFNHIDTPALRTLDVQWPVNFSDSEKMTAVFQFFLRNTGASFEKIEFLKSWYNLHGCILALASADDSYRLRFNGVQAVTSFMPFTSLESITQIYITSPSSLEALMSNDMAFPSLKRIRLTASSLKPKSSQIPQIKRWIKRRASSNLAPLETLTVLGKETLTEKDIKSLQIRIPVEWLPKYTEYNGNPYQFWF